MWVFWELTHLRLAQGLQATCAGIPIGFWCQDTPFELSLSTPRFSNVVTVRLCKLSQSEMSALLVHKAKTECNPWACMVAINFANNPHGSKSFHKCQHVDRFHCRVFHGAGTHLRSAMSGLADKSNSGLHWQITPLRASVFLTELSTRERAREAIRIAIALSGYYIVAIIPGMICTFYKWLLSTWCTPWKTALQRNSCRFISVPAECTKPSIWSQCASWTNINSYKQHKSWMCHFITPPQTHEFIDVCPDQSPWNRKSRRFRPQKATAVPVRWARVHWNTRDWGKDLSAHKEEVCRVELDRSVFLWNKHR